MKAYPCPTSCETWSDALSHLQRDPTLKRIIAAVGPCMLKPRKNPFSVLCQSIYSQQISTKVAATLFGRFRDRFSRKHPTPKGVLALLGDFNAAAWRECGLSRQKRLYLLDLARHFNEGLIPTRRLGRMSDDEVIQSLTAVHGIGRWTAEMFLIFTLNRPDVLPVDDLGLRIAVQRAYRMKERPTAKELTAMGEPWRPYRSVATWYFWRAGDGGDGGW